MYRNHDAVCRKFGFHGWANGSRGEEISTEGRREDNHTQTRAKIATLNDWLINQQTSTKGRQIS
jgi:hypothetical protein